VYYLINFAPSKCKECKEERDFMNDRYEHAIRMQVVDRFLVNCQRKLDFDEAVQESVRAFQSMDISYSPERVMMEALDRWKKEDPR